ncbi:hypothetical protein diail_10631 [Diaporthe ilicicola]|nr:hypothetical protein diail_10631 [Diaporthe ilicicola]
MQWAGLTWDEGPDKGGPFGPYKQSERLDLYRQHVDMLLEKDRAFRCFCSKEDLDFNLQQATSSGATAHYPGTCMAISKSESDRRAANGEPHIVRFKTSEVPVSAPDLVYGAYKKAEREDNFIIMKSDGFPTYHFANVVDDHFMEITHVIRAAEWLISTPKHVELYNAFGWKPPNFAHVGLLVDHQRQKLSKRDIDNVGISVFRDTNILPEALLNFSVLLGWDPSLQNRPHLDKRGRMTLEEMKQNFTLKFTRGDIVVDLAKLKYFQGRFTRDLISGEISDPTTLSNRILKPIQSELKRLQQDLSNHSASEVVAGIIDGKPEHRISLTRDPVEPTGEYIHAVLKASKGPLDSHRQFIKDNLYAFWPPSPMAYRNSFTEFQSGMSRIKMERSSAKVLNMDISKVLVYLRNDLRQLSEGEWTHESLGAKAKSLADSVTYYDTEKDHAMDHGAGWKFLRWGLLVGMPGLSVVPMMVLLGRNESLKRLRMARKSASSREEQMARDAKIAAKRAKVLRLRAHQRGQPMLDDQNTVEDEVSKRRNVKIRNGNHKPAEPPSGAAQFLRPINESSLPEKGPFVSQPRPERDSAIDQSPAPQFLSLNDWKTGHRRIWDVKQADSADAAPSRKWPKERRKRTMRSGPADQIHPFEEGGSFFTPDPETEASRPESAQQPRRTFHPPDGPSHMLLPRHSEEAERETGHTGPFLRSTMSNNEYVAHIEHVRGLNEEKSIRQAMHARQRRLKQPRSGYPVEQPGGLRSEVGDAFGPFYADEPVPHPARTNSTGANATEYGFKQVPRQEAEDPKVVKNVKESWVKPGTSKRAQKREPSRR